MPHESTDWENSKKPLRGTKGSGDFTETNPDESATMDMMSIMNYEELQANHGSRYGGMQLNQESKRQPIWLGPAGLYVIDDYT